MRLGNTDTIVSADVQMRVLMDAREVYNQHAHHAGCVAGVCFRLLLNGRFRGSFPGLVSWVGHGEGHGQGHGEGQGHGLTSMEHRAG